MESGLFMTKKIGGKKSHATDPASFVSMKTNSSKILFFLFLKAFLAEEKGQEHSGNWQETVESCGIAEVKF
jgi:hypothetical protein